MVIFIEDGKPDNFECQAMTEAAHQMTSNPLPPGERRPGSVGLPQGVQLRTLDDDGNDVPEGEVCIKGPNGACAVIVPSRRQAAHFCVLVHITQLHLDI
jgi:acyl-coenzyme A synthetase/AMP-(fatty) acid ligase